MATIFALSSGSPPAAIAVVRISGPNAGDALKHLMGGLPEPRRARLTSLRAGSGALLDQALVLWFPGPKSETGEDCAELQLHGGRAVVDAVCAELATLAGLRAAEPGEFTRRAFANGRVDLLQVEGLADLVTAETELQRRMAMGLAAGSLSQRVNGWLNDLLKLSAQVEASLDFDDEGDVPVLGEAFRRELTDLSQELEGALAAPSAESLRDGFRVAIAGPPNAGKSMLFNRLLEGEAAIVSSKAGTTRDVLVRNVAVEGIPFTLIDMAGLRDDSADEIEAIGIERARQELANADCVLWLGPEGEGPEGCWEIEAQVDRPTHQTKSDPRCRISAMTGEGVGELWNVLLAEMRGALPGPGQTVLAKRQRALIGDAARALTAADPGGDILVLAEQLRLARAAFDRLTGRAATEQVLDALFGRFCIGK